MRHRFSAWWIYYAGVFCITCDAVIQSGPASAFEAAGCGFVCGAIVLAIHRAIRDNP